MVQSIVTWDVRGEGTFASFDRLLVINLVVYYGTIPIYTHLKMQVLIETPPLQLKRLSLSFNII